MKILKEVLSLSTTSFHEEAVSDYVKNACAKLKLKVKADKFGNLIVRYKKGKPKQPVIFTAHMDHPGFEVLRVKDNLCEIGIIGGLKLEYIPRTRILIKTNDRIIRGVIANKPLKKMWHKKPVFEVRTKGKPKVGDFGWHDLPVMKIKNGMIHTKAADDLANVAALVELLNHLVKQCLSADVTCVFTKVEELGALGCAILAKQKILPKNVPLIVLECSSAAAGHVRIGGGPTIRVGDRLVSFSPEIDCWLKSIAERISKKDKNFRYQRALLGGGVCEGTTWTLRGHITGGLILPLGNYHNSGIKKYAPEYVSVKDYKWMAQLLLATSQAEKLSRAFDGAKKYLHTIHKIWQSRVKIT